MIGQPEAAGELRVLEPRGLRQFRLRDADGLELRLQRAVVEQRNADARLRGQVRLQERRYGLFDFITLDVVTHPAHFLSGASGDVSCHIFERRLRIRARAADERQRQGCHRQWKQLHHRHHFFSSVPGFALVLLVTVLTVPVERWSQASPSPGW